MDALNTSTDQKQPAYPNANANANSNGIPSDKFLVEQLMHLNGTELDTSSPAPSRRPVNGGLGTVYESSEAEEIERLQGELVDALQQIKRLEAEVAALKALKLATKP